MPIQIAVTKKAYNDHMAFLPSNLMARASGRSRDEAIVDALTKSGQLEITDLDEPPPVELREAAPIPLQVAVPASATNEDDTTF